MTELNRGIDWELQKPRPEGYLDLLGDGSIMVRCEVPGKTSVDVSAGQSVAEFAADAPRDGLPENRA